VTADDAEVREVDYCYVTTTGRVSGRPHTIEIWFALHGRRVYLLSGGGEASDWVRNIRTNPTVGLRLGDRDYLARAYVVEDPAEDELARSLLVEKYASRTTDDLEGWRRTSLPVAIELPA
jgi:deazaflavin-dependent oxidoreductase (nitroreductase family)